MAILTHHVRPDLDNQRFDSPTIPDGVLHEPFRLHTPFPSIYKSDSVAEDRQREINLAFRLQDDWEKVKMDAHSKEDSVMLAEMKDFERMQVLIAELAPLKSIRQSLREKIHEVPLNEAEAQNMAIEGMQQRTDTRNALQADLDGICDNINAAEDEKAAIEKKRDQVSVLEPPSKRLRIT